MSQQALIAALSKEDLLALRTECGLTIPEAAQRLGVARSTWWRWESKGEQIPTQWTRKIREIFDPAGNLLPTPAVTSQDKVVAPLVALSEWAGESADILIQNHPLLALPPSSFASESRMVAHGVIAVVMEGDAMEPTVRSGETMLVVPIREGSAPVDGVHVLRIEGASMVRRLARRPGVGYLLTAENSATYGPIDVPVPTSNEFAFTPLGRVICVLRRM